MSVDKTDWIFYVRADGRKEKKYRHFCDKCEEDKGYCFNSVVDGIASENRPCRACSAVAAGFKNRGRMPPNKGKPISESTRLKLRNFNLGKTSPSKGIPVSEEQKIKISCSVRGIAVEDFDDFGWKKETIRKQKFNTELRYECFKLANYTCDRCSLRGCTLNAHHLYDFNNHPDLLNDIDNLVCLCSKCHVAFHKAYGRTIRNKNCVNTKEQYLEFKESFNVSK
jgi:hypothetical protein